MNTAMEELYYDLEKFKQISETISITDVQRMIAHYKNEKEKQQILEAVSYGQNNHSVSITSDLDIMNDYYNETYSQ